MEATRPRQIYLEIIRILALFCVVYNHTGIYGWRYYTVVQGLEMWINLFWACICKIGVPLFLMVSGATLLCKQENISTLLSKRILRFSLLIFLISTVSYLYICITNGYQMSIFHFANTALSTFDLCSYYLWIYLALLLSLPFLRIIAANLQRQQAIYLLICLIIFKHIFPLLKYILGIQITNMQSYVSFFTELYVYPLLGYYISYRTPCIDTALQNKYVRSAIIIIVPLSVFMHCWLKYQCAFTWKISDETFDNWSAILSIFIFYFCKKKFKEESIRPRLKKFILWFTPNILGVFLLSAQLLYIFLEIYGFSSRYLPAQLSCFIWVLFVIAISTIIISVLRKIPGVKKLL